MWIQNFKNISPTSRWIYSSKYTNIFSYHVNFQQWISTGSRNISQWKIWTGLFYFVNTCTVVSDVLLTEGARVSAAILYSYFNLIIRLVKSIIFFTFDMYPLAFSRAGLPKSQANISHDKLIFSTASLVEIGIKGEFAWGPLLRQCSKEYSFIGHCFCSTIKYTNLYFVVTDRGAAMLVGQHRLTTAKLST